MDGTKDLAEAADALAVKLMRAPPCDRRQHATDGLSCVARERARPWRGHRARPTFEQDPRKMCDACAALWHVEVAAVLLHRVEQGEAMVEAGK